MQQIHGAFKWIGTVAHGPEQTIEGDIVFAIVDARAVIRRANEDGFVAAKMVKHQRRMARVVS